jgi:HlyD family secretion protein
MKKTNFVTSLGLIVLVILGAWYYFSYHRTKSGDILTTPALKGEFKITVAMVGNIKAKKSVSVSSPIQGKIVKLCPEGKMVKTGDFLVQLDTSELEVEYLEKQLNYKNALNERINALEELEIARLENELKIKQAEADLDFNLAELKSAKDKLEREQRLLKEQLVKISEVEAAADQVRSKELAVTKSKLNLDIEKKQAQSISNQKQANLDNKNSGLEIKTKQLSEIKDKIKNATILSPASGMVVIMSTWKGDNMGKISEGDTIWRGRPIIELPDLSKMMIMAKIEEMRISKIKIGQNAVVKLDAFPDKIYHASVTEISRLASITTWQNLEEGGTPGKRYFEVTLDLKEANPNLLRPGATVNIEILIKTIPDAVYLPKECIFEPAKGKTMVYLKEGNKWMAHPVKLGDDNDNFVCVISGLKGGEEAALSEPGGEVRSK